VISISSTKAIIDKWDPIDLLFHAPPDEYDSEVAEIEHLLKTATSNDELAQGIYKIFHESFGDNVFQKTYADCSLIAQKILSQ